MTAPLPAVPRLGLGLIAALALPLPAAAQAAPSLWDLIKPDRIVARMVQSGIMALRSQFDVVYGGISVSPLTGTVTLTDVKAWPKVPWPVDSVCSVSFDRITIHATPVDEVDLVRVKLLTSGAKATLDCLPPPARGAASMLSIDEMSLSRLTMDVDYRISTAGASTHLFALADGLASVTVNSDFDYLWFDGSQNMDHPKPVAILKSARLSLENLGAWDKVKPMLPPPVVDPAQSDQMIDHFFEGMLGTSQPGGTEPSAQREPFIASAKSAWSAFLADPKELVLETGFDPAAPRYLNLMDWNDSPDPMLDDLEPRMGLAPAARSAILPTALIQKALDTPDQLSDDERLQVGTAFATGTGAPRDVATALSLLAPLADAGNGDAALALARAQETRDPAAAYHDALLAASASAAGAAGLLDRLERVLPFDKVLEQQGSLLDGIQRSTDPLASIALIRNEAAMRLTGNGRSRSYAEAELWALIGAAAGDAECQDILDEIDEKIRYAGADAQTTWAAQEQASVELARQAWVGFDLPTTFGTGN